MPRLRVLAAAATAALVLTSFTAVPPSFSAEASVPVPPQAWVTITGHGYGHGHGMSQYGAEGAARQGLSAQAIVNFYYPGTRRGIETGKISVLLTADTDDNTVILARAGLTVRDLGAGRRWTLPDNGARRWRLSVGPGGASKVGYLTDAWHPWRTLAGDGAFSAGGAPITLVTPAGKVAYRGALRSVRPSSGSRSRDTVNVLKLDSYLRGVVPREMPATWMPAAVRAQAIAARTYAAYERAHPLSSTYQICDTTSCQVYGGYSAEHPDSNAAIVATAGKVQTYAGEPAFTQFASSSGGWTSAGSVPYLAAQADPYDDWAGNPVHTWSTKVDARTIERAWPAIGNLTAIRVVARDGNGAWGGRVVTLRLVGGKAKVTVSGDTFRSVLGLRSTWLSFKAAAK